GEAAGATIEVRLDIAPDLPPAAIAPVSLQLVVVQLVRNACRAMARRASGHVTIAARHTKGTITVAVADDGPGVPPEAAATLLQPDDPARRGGVGVGLSTCKATVGAHDGRLG